MLDFTPVFAGQTTMAELTAHLSAQDLRNLTNEIIDLQRDAIAAIEDADVTFVPVDPAANDTFAAAGVDATVVNMAWTLGHVIVHATASSEEAAALALTLARGLPVEGRSRYEVPWETVTAAAQVVQRLEESRRMRLAMLDAWPDQPHLDNSYTPIPQLGPLNPPARFALGLLHDQSHIDQIRDIVAQAQAARAGQDAR
jgi:hypothetical protein